ncbi:MAG: peptidylprolyl isomerase, partial [Nanoarchaeota archaeon]
MTIKEGSKVTLHYTGTRDDGSVFDSSEGREPLTFTVGQHQVICGFEEGVIGMEVGEEKTIDMTPEHGYGERHEQMVQKVPNNLFKDFTPEKGQQIGLMSKDGRQMTATVVAIENDIITLDLNHQLAGKNLHFKV